MTDFAVDPTAVGGAADLISGLATELEDLELAKSFSTLSGAFTGATNPMTAIASGGDRQIASSLANAAGTVTAFSEMITSFKNSTVELDGQNASYIRLAVPYPVPSA